MGRYTGAGEPSIPGLQKNRAIFERLTAVGGKPYPVDAVPMSPEDWRGQFHLFWGRFAQARRRDDPDGILTLGQGIF